MCVSVWTRPTLLHVNIFIYLKAEKVWRFKMCFLSVSKLSIIYNLTEPIYNHSKRYYTNNLNLNEILLIFSFSCSRHHSFLSRNLSPSMLSSVRLPLNVPSEDTHQQRLADHTKRSHTFRMASEAQASSHFVRKAKAIRPPVTYFI